MKKPLSLVMLAALLTVGLGADTVIATPLALQDLGNTTYDPNSGLEWLDLNLTAGQSYSSVLSGWNGYTTTQGFRFATRNEVIQMFTDLGATVGSATTPVYAANNLLAATLGLSLLGTTLALPTIDRSWMFYKPATEPTLPGSAYVPAAVFGVGVIRAGYPPEGFFDVPGIFPTTGYGSPEMASALVRTASVPDTSSTALQLSACLGLILIALKLSKRKTKWSDCRMGCKLQ